MVVAFILYKNHTLHQHGDNCFSFFPWYILWRCTHGAKKYARKKGNDK